jgi:hypothetical protein
MKNNNIVNGINLVPSQFIEKNFKNSFGFNWYFFKILEKRLEFFIKFNIINYPLSHWLAFIKHIMLFIPINKTFKKRRLVNIYFLDLISSYRGWRHSRGLPVRGQRTWTNAWSSYKSNLILREYRIEVSKRVYGSIQISHLSIAYLAEQINLLWKFQWERAWKSAKKKRLIQAQNENIVQKIDLLSMSKGLGNFVFDSSSS